MYDVKGEKYGETTPQTIYSRRQWYRFALFMMISDLG